MTNSNTTPKTTKAPKAVEPLMFKIEGEMQELKLNYAGIKYLNGLYEGGSFELIGKALMGDIETFPHIILAALKHTDGIYNEYDVEESLDEMIEAGELSLKDVIRISNVLVARSPFYKATVDQLMKNDPAAQASIDALMG
ncbi:tail assembly chaperone [Sporosarcina sp. ACRSL]|uniref:tail assembly chaperone n=1 Tax=Sporosarcina sp. ACRSL TaxID=2918215 RepID=UPI001EF4059C|nr:tail assembly chaperone [Sporosarcina sp. ACRSL]MCG7346378.1 tail assembly chaperone [Sporosarcina sp. ACRSL]